MERHRGRSQAPTGPIGGTVMRLFLIIVAAIIVGLFLATHLHFG